MISSPYYNAINPARPTVNCVSFVVFLKEKEIRRKHLVTGTAESEISVKFRGGGSPKWLVDVYVLPYFLPRSSLLLIIQLLLKLSCFVVPQFLSLRHLNYQLSSARLLAKPPPVPPSIREFMVLGLLILPTFERSACFLFFFLFF